jgi:hypothetical protein
MSCSLDSAGRQRQAARYARVAQSVISVERGPRQLAFHLAPDVDRSALDEAIAVERECCPFYEIDLTDDAFTIGVATDDYAPALEAIADLLNPAAPSPASRT